MVDNVQASHQRKMAAHHASPHTYTAATQPPKHTTLQSRPPGGRACIEYHKRLDTAINEHARTASNIAISTHLQWQALLHEPLAAGDAVPPTNAKKKNKKARARE